MNYWRIVSVGYLWLRVCGCWRYRRGLPYMLELPRLAPMYGNMSIYTIACVDHSTILWECKGKLLTYRPFPLAQLTWPYCRMYSQGYNAPPPCPALRVTSIYRHRLTSKWKSDNCTKNNLSHYIICVLMVSCHIAWPPRWGLINKHYHKFRQFPRLRRV